MRPAGVDLSFLHPLYDTPGPFVSCYLDTSWDVEDAQRAIALRWRHLRTTAAEHGAGESTLQALDGAVAGVRAVPGAHGLALFGAGGHLVSSHDLPCAPAPEIAHVGPLPDVLPLAVQLSVTVPHVLVLADRLGADITAYGPDGHTAARRHVEGSTDEVTKRGAGGYQGWSQHRYQRRAENTWDHNARLVADEVDRLVSRTGSRALVVAGDVRARGALRDHLAKRSLAVLTERDAGDRDAPETRTALETESARVVAETAAGDRRAVLSRFAEARGQGGRAVTGLPTVTAALRQGRVEALLVRPGVLGQARLWVGPELMQVATRREHLAAVGVDAPVSDLAGSALVRALVGCRGTMVALPDGDATHDLGSDDLPLTGGVGALLRYADPLSRGRRA